MKKSNTYKYKEFRIKIFTLWGITRYGGNTKFLLPLPGHYEYNHNHFLLVRVFRNSKLMMEAEKSFSKKHGYSPCGSFYSCVRWHRRICKDGKNIKNNYAVMFTHRKAVLNPEVVAHESLHGAAAFLRVLLKPKNGDHEVCIGSAGGSYEEERLAYLTGYISGEISKSLVSMDNLLKKKN